MLRPFSDPCVTGVKGTYRTHQHEHVARLAQIEFDERYDLLAQLNTIDFIDTYAAAFRIDVLKKSGGFDPAFIQNEDVDLSYRLAQTGYKLVFNRQAVVYHTHPSTWRTYFFQKIKRGYWRMLAYRQHPSKAVNDSYTPQLLKVQIVLMYLILGLSGLVLAFHPLIWSVLIALIVLCLSAIPFVKRAGGQDHALMIPALFFVALRALAFAIGIVGGLFKVIFFRPSLLHFNEER
jgi:GT2 family glycosyltransferase